jgi:hypothetical protein
MGVRLNGVNFDGCLESDGTMLDATVTGPWFLSLPISYFVRLRNTGKQLIKLSGKCTQPAAER